MSNSTDTLTGYSQTANPAFGEVRLFKKKASLKIPLNCLVSFKLDDDLFRCLVSDLKLYPMLKHAFSVKFKMSLVDFMGKTYEVSSTVTVFQTVLKAYGHALPESP